MNASGVRKYTITVLKEKPLTSNTTRNERMKMIKKAVKKVAKKKAVKKVAKKKAVKKVVKKKAVKKTK